MKYKIQFLKPAQIELNALGANVRRRVYDKILKLADDPRPRGVKHLSGSYAGCLRIRIGSFRVVYEVNDDNLIVIIVEVVDRKDAY